MNIVIRIGAPRRNNCYWNTEVMCVCVVTIRNSETSWFETKSFLYFLYIWRYSCVQDGIPQHNCLPLVP